MAVPRELVQSSKALYDAYRPNTVVARTTLDVIIGGWPWTTQDLRLLAFMLPDRSLTIRLEHAGDEGVLRVCCTPSVDGVLTVEQGSERRIRGQITNGTATVQGVERTWTTVVVRPDRWDAGPVQTAWTLL